MPNVANSFQNRTGLIINLGEYKMTNYTNIELQDEFNQFFTRREKYIDNPVKRLFKTLDLWNKRKEERKQLSKVDERLLKDMGISKLDAQQEIAKPFWQE